MQTVFEASNAVEAHMVRELLREAGITAHVLGEALPGAAGLLPVNELVRLVVAPEDHARARNLVEQWDAAQPKDLPPPPPRRRGPAVMAGVLAGMAFGALIVWTALRSPLPDASGVDHDGDGTLDERHLYAATGHLLRTEFDRNRDGRIDQELRYDRFGHLQALEADDDFNGVMETHGEFRSGLLTRLDRDTDGDGTVDLRQWHTHDRWDRTEHIDPTSGQVARVDHRVFDRIVRAEVDTDRDGRLDTELLYSRLGDVQETRRLP